MSKFNPDLIQKARKGEIAILNDGSVEELNKILNEAWAGENTVVAGDWKYYKRHSRTFSFPIGTNATAIPARSVKDFFMPDTTTDPKSYLTEITKPPRTYKVTRGQMKEIWQILPVDADGEEFRNSLKYLFDPFENEAELNEAQVKRIMKNFPEVQPSKLRSIFPSYFYIPEGEPVLMRYNQSGKWLIRVSDGKGGFYIDGNLNGISDSAPQIIPFTKNPPK